MKITIAALALLLAACGSSSDHDECSQFKLSGRYRIEYSTISGNCFLPPPHAANFTGNGPLGELSSKTIATQTGQCSAFYEYTLAASAFKSFEDWDVVQTDPDGNSFKATIDMVQKPNDSAFTDCAGTLKAIGKKL